MDREVKLARVAWERHHLDGKLITGKEIRTGTARDSPAAHTHPSCHAASTSIPQERQGQKLQRQHTGTLKMAKTHTAVFSRTACGAEYTYFAMVPPFVRLF